MGGSAGDPVRKMQQLLPWRRLLHELAAERERERGFFDRDLGKNKKPMLSKVFKLIHKKDSLMSEQPELLGKIRTDQLTETYVRGRNEKNET